MDRDPSESQVSHPSLKGDHYRLGNMFSETMAIKFSDILELMSKTTKF